MPCVYMQHKFPDKYSVVCSTKFTSLKFAADYLQFSKRRAHIFFSFLNFFNYLSEPLVIGGVAFKFTKESLEEWLQHVYCCPHWRTCSHEKRTCFISHFTLSSCLSAVRSAEISFFYYLPCKNLFIFFSCLAPTQLTHRNTNRNGIIGEAWAGTTRIITGRLLHNQQRSSRGKRCRELMLLLLCTYRAFMHEEKSVRRTG